MKTKLLIFGITGDLSRRKLLPALQSVVATGQFDSLEIIGVSRREITVTELLGAAGESALKDRLRTFSMNVAKAEEYARLKQFVALEKDEQLLVYLSVPPGAATQIVDFLGEAGLNMPNVKILFEKPFGVDLSSAKDIISRTARYYEEEQIYRIDHYLAKEMAQNIVALRGGNALLGHIWNKAAIEKIEVLALEKIGIEGRAGFYEQAGALRDVVQGHLMQLLALVLMDIPPELNWKKLPEMRQKALEAMLPARPENAIRAQYDTYQTEVENPGSQTETFVKVGLESRDPRWEGVPLVLITGKALDKKTTEIRVHLRRQHEAESNCITLHIQPDEGVEMELFTKKPGYERAFETQKLAYKYPEDAVLPDAYEQVLVDAIRSQKSLFTSSDEVLRSWQILQPLLDSWNMQNDPLEVYGHGTRAGGLT